MSKLFHSVTLIIESAIIIAVLSVSSHSQGERSEAGPTDSLGFTTTVADTAEIKAIDIENMSDEAWLLFYDAIPTGITYQQTKAFLPSLGERRQIGGAYSDARREEDYAYFEFVFAGHSAQVQFDFRQDTLRAYGFIIRDIDSATTERLGSRILDFYVGRFGEYKHETQGFENFINDCYYWESDVWILSLCVNIYRANSGYIGWSKGRRVHRPK